MALTSETHIDKVEILEDGQLQVREAKIILEDGVEISRAYHRRVLDPGVDTTTDVDTKTTGMRSKIDVLAVATSIWTQEVIDARIAKLATERTRERTR